MQLKDCFSQDAIELLKQMHLFTPASLRCRKKWKSSEIQTLCDFYTVNSDLVANEINELAAVYVQIENVVSLDDNTIDAVIADFVNNRVIPYTLSLDSMSKMIVILILSITQTLY